MATLKECGQIVTVNYRGKELLHYVTPEAVFTPDLAPFVDHPEYDVSVYRDSDGWWCAIKYDEGPPLLVALDWPNEDP